jgi:hypothetical protein
VILNLIDIREFENYIGLGSEVDSMKDGSGIKKSENEEKCEVNRCGCSVNYIMGGIAVILLVLFIASTIK